ncbi:hypothetical protein OC861_001863 [Tilletia horrida]|nr:hypothetical protein OC861_001863 [Tilletia horrida]
MPHKRAKRSIREADRFAKGVDLPPVSSNLKGGDANLPKGAMRVLMGAKVRADFQDRRKQRAEGNRIGAGTSAPPDVKGKKKATNTTSDASPANAKKTNLKVLPGETLANFNRRVERTLASDINASLRAAASTSEKKGNKKKRKRGEGDDADDESNVVSKARSAEIAAARRAAEPSSADLKRARDAIVGGKGKSAEDDVEKDWAKVDQRRRINDVADAPPRLTRVPKLRGAAAVKAAAAESRPSSRSRSLADDFEVAVPAEAEYDPELDDDEVSKRKQKKSKTMALTRQSGVAQAVSRGRRGASSSSSSSGSTKAQAPMAPVRAKVLAQERESAIERYRALKEARIQQRNASAG